MTLYFVHQPEVLLPVWLRTLYRMRMKFCSWKVALCFCLQTYFERKPYCTRIRGCVQFYASGSTWPWARLKWDRKKFQLFVIHSDRAHSVWILCSPVTCRIWREKAGLEQDKRNARFDGGLREKLRKLSWRTEQARNGALFARYTSDVIASCAFGITIDSFDFTPRVARSWNVKFVDEKKWIFFQKSRAFHDSSPRWTDMVVPVGTVAQAFMFFFSGFEITATQVCIIAHELAISPEIQRRLQK